MSEHLYPHHGQAMSTYSRVSRVPSLEPAPVPVTVDVQDGRPMWQSVLSSIKDVIVIVTCLAILYTMYRGYVALQAVGDALEQMRAGLGGLGG